MTVLSVSLDNQEFLHFYLDKNVCVDAGVYFSLSPYLGESTVEVFAADVLREVGTRSQDSNLLVSHRLKIKNIYTFFYHEKERGFLFSGESHPLPELTYVDQGTLHSVADGLDLVLEQGDMALYGPGQWHMQYADVEVAPRFVTISFDVEGGDLSGLLNRKFQMPQKAVTLLQQMLREQERMDTYSDDMIISLLNQLLLILLRESDAPSGDKLKASNSVHSENEIIRQAQQYISAHIREKLSVPLVARMVDISPSYLTALFHKNLQISPGEYIRRIKLQESKQMIREDNLNFTEIAAALQYSTVHHFSRQFKEKFGITPSEYAKSVR
jgi:AraC-like DNA-binding protein